jgi:hypothetical protein
MNKSFAAPRTIRRIAARRVFQSANGKPVVLTIGVPQPVPGLDWGCALQITGLKAGWSRPRYVFGIDGVQALQLAMKCAAAVIESTRPPLTWLDQGDYLMPKFLPLDRGNSSTRRAVSPTFSLAWSSRVTSRTP